MTFKHHKILYQINFANHSIQSTMSSTILRPHTARFALRTLSSIPKHAHLASTTFLRHKATLPDLPCMLHSSLHPLLSVAFKLTLPFSRRRLRRARTLHLRKNHGAASQKPSQHLCNLVQRRRRKARRGLVPNRTDCSTAPDQFPRRRACQSLLVLGEPGAPERGRRRPADGKTRSSG